jgi:hypothetical protein
MTSCSQSHVASEVIIKKTSESIQMIQECNYLGFDRKDEVILISCTICRAMGLLRNWNYSDCCMPGMCHWKLYHWGPKYESK